MKRRLLMKAAGAAAAYGALASGRAGAQGKMTLNVQYPLGFIFDKVFAELKTEFEKANPDLQVNYLPAYKEYEDASQTGLRQAITKQLPDVGLQAINLQRLFVDRKIAVDISPFIAKEKDWQGQGFSPSMMALSTYGGKPYGLAFASCPRDTRLKIADRSPSRERRCGSATTGSGRTGAAGVVLGRRRAHRPDGTSPSAIA